MFRFFDGYVIKSRIIVSVLLFLPLIIIGPWILRIFTVETNPWIYHSIVTTAILTLGATIVRQFGLREESRLLREWGGYPSTGIMRWRDNYKSTEWKKRIHLLSYQKTGIKLPSQENEKNNPEEADKRIRDVFCIIKSKIWGKGDSASHSANANYGFTRNLYGCRWLWFSLSFSCLFFLLVAPLFRDMEFAFVEIFLCTSITIAIPILETYVIKPLIFHCAYQYAENAWENLNGLEL